MTASRPAVPPAPRCKLSAAHGAKRVVLAVPVAPPDTLEELSSDADEIVCLASPTPFFAIGEWYRDFSQVPDERVVSLLALAATPAADLVEATSADDPPEHRRDEEVTFRVGHAVLAGHLTVPVGAVGLVLFAHGSGSSRHSPRNQFVARALNGAQVGTLLFDLLSRDEELTARTCSTSSCSPAGSSKRPTGRSGASLAWRSGTSAPVRGRPPRSGRPANQDRTSRPWFREADGPTSRCVDSGTCTHQPCSSWAVATTPSSI